MRSHLAPPVIFALVILTVTSALGEVLSDVQARVFIDRKDQISQLRSLDLDVVWNDKNYVDIITSQPQIDSLNRIGFRTETVHQSVGGFYRARLPQVHMGGYKTLSEIYAYLDGMIADHPELISAKQSIGTTIQGRDIWAVKISDNPNVDEDEPEVLYTALIHAREMVTPEILFYFMDHLTNQYSSDPGVTDLVNNRQIWFVLVCNPDGYYMNELIAPYGGGMWRMNLRDNGDGSYGVDLNRNWGYMWGYDNVGSSPYPGSETYRGTGPFSEPETQALRDFILARHFVLSVFWHSFANILIYPWGYVRQQCPDDDIYSALGDSVSSMNGYTPGLVADLLYPTNGGAFDWEYGEQSLKAKVYGTTIESGNQTDGFWPTLERAEQMKQENLQPLMFLTRIAGNINSLRPPGPPQIVGLPSSVNGAAYDVNWVETDPDNPGAQFELVELQKRRDIVDPGESLAFWQTDSFTVSTARSWTGGTSIYSGTGEFYVSHLTTSHPYTVQPGDMLTFQTYYDLEFYWDFAYVEISTDGLNFASIPGNLTSNFNPNGGNRGNGISGSSGAWTEAVFDLSAYEGQQVWFRFTYENGNTTFGEGWYLDDIHPHVMFDSVAVIASDLTSPTYQFTDKPMGVYYYQVRVKDAQGQWGLFSTLGRTEVLGSGIGDIDLDGVNSTVGDLALFSMFFDQGLPVFDIYPGVQTGEADADCDGLAASTADLSTLAQVVIGAASPCYPVAAPVTGARFETSRSAAGSMNANDPSAHSYDALYSVVMQTTSFQGEDSVLVDLVLTDADSSLLGFQFHIEYDTAALVLEDTRRGDAITNWQFFEYHTDITGVKGELTVAGVAQYQGASISPDDIDLRPTPAQVVRLKFRVVSPGQALNSLINFIWSRSGDNAIVRGRFDSGHPVVDSLALSRLVRDPDGVDITGLDPRYGGADYTCFYGLFGHSPAALVDFSNGRVVRDAGCCVARVGDANGVGGDEPTIGDVSAMIDAKFITGSCDGILPCLTEADINQSGGTNPTCDDITISDISVLIDYLFITGSSLGLPNCL